MEFTFFNALELIGSLGFFIYGMKVMSEGLQKAAGTKMRQILGAMTRNRFFGVLTGFLITAIIQSSSATTVMTVSFVNAGLMTLIESAGVMMGANVGTTITGWLISSLGFTKIKIVIIALPIIAIGAPMMFSKKSRLKSVSEIIIGFALLFMGLDFLKQSVPDLKHNPQVLEFLSNYTDFGFFTPIIFIGVGTLVTIIIQSSSAAMALTLVMCNNGWIPFEIAAAMILGENIGTTITAELASIVGNVHAKRSARVHSMFNIVGVTWMLFAMPVYLKAIAWAMPKFGLGNNPFEEAGSIPIALSLFHTAFNVSNVLLLIGFVPHLVKLAIRTVPSKGDFDEEFHLEFLGAGVLATPDLSIVEAKKEVSRLGELTRKQTKMVDGLLVETDKKKFSKSLAKIKKYEEITDRMEVEIADYLAKVSEHEMSESSSKMIRAMLSIVNDLERVADINYQMSKMMERKAEQKLWFTPDQRQNLKDMFNLADNALKHMEQVLRREEIDVNRDSLLKAQELETAINKMRNKLRKEHLENIGKGDYNIQSGMVYNDLFSSIEKVGDHVINVTEALTEE